MICSEYNLRSLRRGFGQLRDIRYETMESGKPSLVIHSSTLGRSENDIVIATNAVLHELIKTELRKRFAIVHTEKCVYIIGGMYNIVDETFYSVYLIGYIYDPQTPARRKPLKCVFDREFILPNCLLVIISMKYQHVNFSPSQHYQMGQVI